MAGARAPGEPWTMADGPPCEAELVPSVPRHRLRRRERNEAACRRSLPAWVARPHSNASPAPSAGGRVPDRIGDRGGQRDGGERRFARRDRVLLSEARSLFRHRRRARNKRPRRGQFPGWPRTGFRFKFLAPATAVATVSPGCRFYGSPAAGLDSHFYPASPSECNPVKLRFPGVWLFESGNVFLVGLPDPVNGHCQSGTAPIYRSWNGRTDSNHRYTTDPGVQQSMIARGYIAEGYGPPPMPVAMCSPGTAAGPPSCSLVTSDSAPLVGSSVTLTALCDGNATAYTWTGCASTGSTCIATSSTTGSRTYTLPWAPPWAPRAPARA